MVTPGVKTDMLDDTKETYGRHLDTSGWTEVTPEEWAKQDGRQPSRTTITSSGRAGASPLAKLASRGPAFVLDAITGSGFTRAKRPSSEG